MNFIKKMCILRQLKDGFAGDGKTLSGLVKIEQYGRNLSVEVSVINFAPLKSGEYYCLIADEKNRTELLSLCGKSFFNLVSELDVESGFCAVICFVKNGVYPVAYGVNGEKVYDFDGLIASSVFPGAEETAFAFKGKSGGESKYDDEKVVTENYYKEQGYERDEFDESDENAYASSAGEVGETDGQDARKNENGENVRRAFEPDGDEYYRAVRDEIDELFKNNEKDESLAEVFPSSEWVKVREPNKKEYLVGVIYKGWRAKYICYALPTENGKDPPEEIKDVCTFVPSSLFCGESGYFVLFQSCATGECVKNVKGV